MATSGSTDYSRTAAQIIAFAHKLLQLIPSGGSVGTNEEADGLESLNLMVKSWMMDGVKLWTHTDAHIYLVDGQASYDLPGANGAKKSEIAETTLDAAEASGQTVISVTSTTGFANSDVIGIVQDDDTIHWSTISSFVTDDTVTIAGATTAAAASGNKVYVYTNAIERPLRIISARMDNASNEIPMYSLSRQEYFDLPNKSSTGIPTQFYYDPQLGTGKLYLWPVPESVDYVFKCNFQRTLEDFDATTDTPDLPQEWLEALGYNLAIRIAPQYGKAVPREVAIVAAELKDLVSDWDQEEESVYFGAK
jgi:hypothetical protein